MRPAFRSTAVGTGQWAVKTENEDLTKHQLPPSRCLFSCISWLNTPRRQKSDLTIRIISAGCPIPRHASRKHLARISNTSGSR